MFGYVIADKSALTEAQLKRYRGSYCGLCRAVGRRCGTGSRFCLSYDMSFLLLLQNGIYGFTEHEQESVCPMHPFRKQYSFESEATGYAADMNVLLAWYNCLDDWRDERNPVRCVESVILRRGAARAAERHGRKAEFIRERLQELAEVETRKERSPDGGANAFAALMGELFVRKEDEYAPVLYELGAELGRFVYLADALVDFRRDEKRQCYNPLTGLFADGAGIGDIQAILNTLAASCCRWLARLPVRKDADILDHILREGIWSIFKEGREGHDIH